MYIKINSIKNYNLPFFLLPLSNAIEFAFFFKTIECAGQGRLFVHKELRVLFDQFIDSIATWNATCCKIDF